MRARAATTTGSRARVAVAMSGGVDSAVAAALLVEQGDEVVGLSMRLYDAEEADGTSRHGCCTPDDLYDARAVARHLGIPHYVLNYREVFRERVVTPFVEAYERGETPNPCVLCNQRVKFDVLLTRAREVGAAYLATGHYARSQCGPDGRYVLLTASDSTKDQSYFLFGITQEALARTLFPVGTLSKRDVRERAAEFGLPVATKTESQEICFVQGHDYRDLLGRRTSVARDGDVVDGAGRVLAHHDGIHRFTVGQRKGLGVAAGAPLYVVAVQGATGRVVVGPREEACARGFDGVGASWIAGEAPAARVRATVRIRYRHPGGEAWLTPLPAGRVCVTFDQAQFAVAPGQAAVFYRGEEVLGGTWIRRARRETDAPDA